MGTLVRFASYCTALARISLMEVILQVGQDKVYYMDTDSLVLACKLPDKFIHDSELGIF